MQVQDFTVIRISPIVYNDRDILEIGVIFTQPQLDKQTHTHSPANHATHTHTHTRQQHSDKESQISTRHTVQNVACAILQYMAFPKNDEQTPLCIFAVSVRFISHGEQSCADRRGK